MILGTSIVVMILLLGRERFVSLTTGPNPHKVPAQILRHELESILIPEGHDAVDQIKTFDREIATGATRHFRAQETVAAVVKQYKDVLVQHGWQVSSERRISGNEKVVKFCKSGMSLTLDLVEEGRASTYYYLGVVWTKSKSDRAHCPDAVKEGGGCTKKGSE